MMLKNVKMAMMSHQLWRAMSVLFGIFQAILGVLIILHTEWNWSNQQERMMMTKVVFDGPLIWIVIIMLIC